MPVYKYKTFEEAEKALWHFHPDNAYYKKIAELWDFADRLSPIKYPPGIYKFKTIEEANRHRDEIEMNHAKKIRAQRFASRKEQRE
ncbi:MAG TPA: hypothetical protein ENH29_00525 [Bacteroidetes bacterium]|nr:hypothetical protein [Bacteroidota bacterium]